MNIHKILLLLIMNSLYVLADAQLFTIQDPKKTNIDFVNYITENEHFNVMNYEYLYNGGGVAIGDINNDGLQDLFFSGNMSSNKLYLNKGSFVFEDISTFARIDKGEGFNTGVTMIDVNADGWLDIYVCKSVLKSPQKRVHNLYINNKNNTFTDRAKEFGLADSSYSTQAYFRDFDLDGDLDLFLANIPEKINEAKKIVLVKNAKGQLQAEEKPYNRFFSCKFMENQDGFFVDKTLSSGLKTHSFALSAVVGDFNNDRYPDIYIANDYSEPDYLFINQKNKTFKEETNQYFQHMSYNSMGSDFEDLNNDGIAELIVTDMLPESNYRQKQSKLMMSYDQYDKLVKYGFKSQFVKNVLQTRFDGKSFSDVSYAAGMAFTDWSWAPIIADFDNDGKKDVYITNGFYRDFTDQDINRYILDSISKAFAKLNKPFNRYQLLEYYPNVTIPNAYYKNLGQLKFQKLGIETGLDIPSFSNGAAYADLDNDGDLDLVVNNINQYAFVFKNNAVENKYGNFLRFKLNSAYSDAGFGAKIQITTPDSGFQEITYYPTKGYLSSHEPFVHFGLGNYQTVNVRVIWSNGIEQRIENVAANQLITLNQAQAISSTPQNVIVKSMRFEDITKQTLISYQHKENEYIDFKLEPLLYKKFSKQGPYISVSDANGDGLDDIFIGGAKDESAQLYLQNSNGTFDLKAIPVWKEDKEFEDMVSQWVDWDKDGDKDLIVTSGGNEYTGQANKYPLRLYLNDGKANFTKANSTVFPAIYVSSKAIAIEDYDKNGWEDVFVAGQIIPGHYGRIPKSYLIRNYGTRYEVDSFDNFGMINDAVWHDMDKDGWKDLIIAGEWTHIQFIKNNAGVLNSTINTVGEMRGLFQKLHLADLDNDGEKDLIVGNLGLNSRFSASTKAPLYLTVNDFDKNGSTDAVISYYNKDTLYPLPIRDLMLDQMIFLKKRFTRYAPYSRAMMKDIFTPDEMKDAQIFMTNNLNSMIVYLNEGNIGGVKKLPQEAQYFPAKAINTFDYDHDGDLDLLLSGNEYGMEIETGYLDAGIGLILRNEGNKKWTPIFGEGYDTKGDVTDVKPIKINGFNCFIVAKNRGFLQILRNK